MLQWLPIFVPNSIPINKGDLESHQHTLDASEISKANHRKWIFFFQKKPGNNDLMVDFNYRAFPPSTGELDFWLPSTLSLHPFTGSAALLWPSGSGDSKRTPQKRSFQQNLRPRYLGCGDFVGWSFLGFCLLNLLNLSHKIDGTKGISIENDNHKDQANVGKYSRHGSYGFVFVRKTHRKKLCSPKAAWNSKRKENTV